MYHYLKERVLNFKSFERAAALVFTILLFVWVFKFTYNLMDTTPAPQEYSDALDSRIQSVSIDPNILLENVGKVEIHNKEVVYTVENTECRATAYFDREYKLKNYTIEDKSITVLGAILSCAGIGVLICVFGYYIFTFVLAVLNGIYLLIFKDYKEE